MKSESSYQYFPDQCAADDLLAAIVQAGHSNTRARRAVLDALCQSGGQATPAALLVLGRARHAELGLVTVYRTLEILSSLGLVRRLHLEDGCHTYAISAAAMQHADLDLASRAVDMHPHSHHIICQRCNRAVEFAGCDIEAVVTSVEAQTGFRVREHWLEMFGVCPECQAEAD
jgi:Fe2+ or Zn2+ uptake regulation protein